MSYIGMLALGGFIGYVVTVGIQSVDDWSDLQKILATIISAALTGGVFSFIEFLGGNKLKDALFFYPIGLVLAMLWAYAPSALMQVQSPNNNVQLLAWLRLILAFTASLFVFAILFSPALRAKLPKT
jgi:phosphate/sulfate permease